MCRILYTNVRPLTYKRIKEDMRDRYRDIVLTRKILAQTNDPYSRGRYQGIIAENYREIAILREVAWHGLNGTIENFLD